MSTLSASEHDTRAEDIAHLNTAARCTRLVLDRLRFDPTTNAEAIAHGEAILAAIGAMKVTICFPCHKRTEP